MSETTDSTAAAELPQAGTQNFSRRALLGGFSALVAACVTQAVAAPGLATSEVLSASEAADVAAEIFRLRAQLPPITKIFLDQQIYCYLEGEPNAIKGDFTYEEWLEGFEPDCVDWINAGCPRDWKGRAS